MVGGGVRQLQAGSEADSRERLSFMEGGIRREIRFKIKKDGTMGSKNNHTGFSDSIRII